MSYIKVYKDNPTVGIKDGTAVSVGTGAEPVESGAIKIPTSGFELGSWIKLAVRCDDGYKTIEDTSRHARISIVDGTPTMWRLSIDNVSETTWGEHLDFIAEIIEENVIFYVQARVEDNELPSNVTDVHIRVAAVVGAV